MTPPSVAFLLAANLFGSGSEHYRVHRPAHVLGNELDWLTFVAPRFAPPEKAKQPWVIEIEGRALTPQVIVTRAIWPETDDSGTFFANVEEATRAVEYAQSAGQIVMLDLDDHPFAWNAEFALREDVDPIHDWGWWDRYFMAFNAVLCSTRWLQELLCNRYPEQTIAYAPNLYDPYRYEECEPSFGRVLGSHLYVKARLRADFSDPLARLVPIFAAQPELTFHHLGEEFFCATCGHPERDHFEAEACDNCACEAFVRREVGSLAALTGLPNDRIEQFPPCSIHELHEHMTWNVGVVPLSDSEWNYAKTEGKGFEMAAAGIPFVALTGEHPLYRVSPGYVGDDDAALAEMIRELTTDPDIWARASAEHRKWAFTIAQEHQLDYVSALVDLSRHNLSK